MRRAQNADTHAPKQPRLSQNISPVCFSFVLVIASDMHLKSEIKKNERKTLIFTQLKISRYNFQVQNGQSCGCVSHLSKDMVRLEMDPHLVGAVEVHSF